MSAWSRITGHTTGVPRIAQGICRELNVWDWISFPIVEFSGRNTKRVLRNFFRNTTNIISLIITRNILKPNLESKGRMVLCRFFLFVLNVETYKNKNSAKKTHTPFTQIPLLGEVHPICFILGAPFTSKSFSFLFKYLFIWLRWVLIVACRIFHIHCSMWELLGLAW